MVTLRLFHGRRSAEESLNDWGLDGPTLGPLESVSISYGGMTLHLPDGTPLELTTVRGLTFYGGVFYGDLEIGDAPPSEQVEASKASTPSEAGGSGVKSDSQAANWREACAVFVDQLHESLGSEFANRARQALRSVVS